jgi:hypothetical protein
MSIPDLPTGQWWLTMTTEEYQRRVDERRAAIAAASPWRLADLEWRPGAALQTGPILFPRITEDVKPKPVVITVPPANLGARG